MINKKAIDMKDQVKVYSELSEDNQRLQLARVKKEIVSSLCQGLYWEELEPFQKQITKAMKKAEELQTPWFMLEYTFEVFEKSSKASKTLESLAKGILDKALFIPGEVNIYKL